MQKKKNKQTRKSKKPLSHQKSFMMNKCKNKIKNHTADPATFFNYAQELYILGDIVNAVKFYKLGLKRNPNNYVALINISLILIGQFEYTQAIFYLTVAIGLTPDQYFAYIYRSVAYLGAEKKEEAFGDFKFVYDNYPDKIHHFSTLDKTRFPQINFDEAIAYSQYPEAIVHQWKQDYYPTVDCPVDEICLMKDYCEQKEVCPQNDTALLRDIIIRRKLGHPIDCKAETRLTDLERETARRRAILKNEVHENEHCVNDQRKNDQRENEYRENEYRENEYRENEVHENEHCVNDHRENDHRENDHRENEYRENEYRENEYRENEQRVNDHRENDHRENEYRENEYRENEQRENIFLKQLHFKPPPIGHLHKLVHSLQNFINRLFALLSYLFIFLIITLNEVQLEYAFTIEI